MEINILDNSKEWIAAVAIISDYDGACHYLPPPNRHHNIIHYLAGIGYPTPITGEQGFVTNYGEFVTREEAVPIAEAAGQLNTVCPKTFPLNQLFSEDLW